jgi:hypothetical protein
MRPLNLTQTESVSMQTVHILTGDKQTCLISGVHVYTTRLFLE